MIGTSVAKVVVTDRRPSDHSIGLDISTFAREQYLVFPRNNTGVPGSYLLAYELIVEVFLIATQGSLSCANLSLTISIDPDNESVIPEATF